MIEKIFLLGVLPYDYGDEVIIICSCHLVISHV